MKNNTSTIRIKRKTLGANMFAGIVSFNLTTIIIITNIISLCVLTSLIKPVRPMKFFGLQPKGKEDRLIPIEKPRLKDYDGRVDTEAEISLLTKSLELIVCDQQQMPFLMDFVFEYINMKQGKIIPSKRISYAFRDAKHKMLNLSLYCANR